ncbi:hypothetical protein Bbelb_015840 [Branchiostoma belcheri]|nr:hypothetical protein Bbelb_015840 [Branchiostoma belcheri]
MISRDECRWDHLDIPASVTCGTSGAWTPIKQSGLLWCGLVPPSAGRTERCFSSPRPAIRRSVGKPEHTTFFPRPRQCCVPRDNCVLPLTADTYTGGNSSRDVCREKKRGPVVRMDERGLETKVSSGTPVIHTGSDQPPHASQTGPNHERVACITHPTSTTKRKRGEGSANGEELLQSQAQALRNASLLSPHIKGTHPRVSFSPHLTMFIGALAGGYPPLTTLYDDIRE